MLYEIQIALSISDDGNHYTTNGMVVLVRAPSMGQIDLKIISIRFYGISTIVGYLMPNPLYTYILNIYDLVWLAFMAYQPL